MSNTFSNIIACCFVRPTYVPSTAIYHSPQTHTSAASFLGQRRLMSTFKYCMYVFLSIFLPLGCIFSLYTSFHRLDTHTGHETLTTWTSRHPDCCRLMPHAPQHLWVSELIITKRCSKKTPSFFASNCFTFLSSAAAYRKDCKLVCKTPAYEKDPNYARSTLLVYSFIFMPLWLH